MLSFGKGTCFNGAYRISTQDMLSGPVKSRDLEGEKNPPLQYVSSNGLSCVIWKVPGENTPTTSSGSLFCHLIDLIVKCFVKLLLEYVDCTRHWRILKFYQGGTIKLVSHDLFFGWHGMGSPLFLAFSREGSDGAAMPPHPMSLPLPISSRRRGCLREPGQRFRFQFGTIVPREFKLTEIMCVHHLALEIAGWGSCVHSLEVRFCAGVYVVQPTRIILNDFPSAS